MINLITDILSLPIDSIIPYIIICFVWFGVAYGLCLFYVQLMCPYGEPSELEKIVGFGLLGPVAWVAFLVLGIIGLIFALIWELFQK